MPSSSTPQLTTLRILVISLAMAVGPVINRAWGESPSTSSPRLAPVVDARRVDDPEIPLAQPAEFPPSVNVPGTPEQPPRPIDTIVVCPRAWRPALDTWLAHRTRQGHHIVIIDRWRSAIHLRTMIQRLAAEQPIRALVLAGDATAPDQTQPNQTQPNQTQPNQTRPVSESVPTFYAEAKVNIRWGSEGDIATDHPYADINNDHVPDIAVGRLPARSAAELQQLTEKVIAYESLQRNGGWRHRVNFVAGIGGFGPVTDTVIEFAAKRLITAEIPPTIDTSMTQASWRSPYCPNPADFRQVTMNTFNEGCLFWVYMGHGHRQELDRLKLPGVDDQCILDVADVERLNCPQGMPIVALLSCYSAAYDDVQDSLAEAMLRQRGGPVAVIGGSRVTMPYAMTILGTAMLDGVFEERLATVGDVLLFGKRALYSPQGTIPDNQRLLDSVARAMSPTRDNLVGERIEHLMLFNLLGDPLTRIEHPQSVAVRVPAEAMAGKPLVVHWKSELGGRCLVELVCRRDRLTFDPPLRTKFDDDVDALREMNETYFRANNRRWAAQTLEVVPGTYRTVLTVPTEATGPAYLRVAVHGANDYALGAAPVSLQGGPSQPTASKPVLERQ
ncbi:MAG: hypothetical protein KDA60_06415 [Planctomycetales bacterium]|nr:hypothetical protein [Planctomycetales bacterium]